MIARSNGGKHHSIRGVPIGRDGRQAPNAQNAQKGHGFIEPDDGGIDVFVHISAVDRAGMATLSEGQRIKYEVLMDRGKASAGNLSAVGI